MTPATFEPRDTPPPLADDEAHLWLLACAEAHPPTVARAARDALDRLLGAYTGCGHAPVIARGAHGKPFAPDWPELEFNLSHSGRHALLAFARRQPLGVDIELGDRRVSHIEIAQRFFAPDEAAALSTLAPAQRARAFQHLWTGKEAVLKALGQGLNFGLAQVEFGIDGGGRVGALRRLRSSAGVPAEWVVHRLEPAPGLAGALAWRGTPRRLCCFVLPESP